MHAAVVKSTFGSENVKKLRVREHFSKFRCRKIVRRCGETCILKSKCTKHDVFGPLLYVLTLKKCTRLWRKAHLEVKIIKTCGVQSTFGRADVENLHAAEAKSTLGSENVLYMLKKCTWLWRKAHWKSESSKPVGFKALFDVLMSKICTTLGSENVQMCPFLTASARAELVCLF